ncbi:DUF4123 domain-containing protein [Burkholderia ubonensis]|uniref:DUF4123 domain-containing protein n=1 Tax=Burkholderia ubonensis TaxID=101571 RepID=UPI000BA59970|nr:DUF4123 domain-containing protein [Burkholderia ubonensis]PAK10667.1 hypothetical protein CJO66_31455 [Burkholderia ubonensis]RQP40666.1 DUF4123 domain-containing protein [Burkholderia ubonensis]RQP41094.1 DUF4123 domain-containing protein [Burkholderia ubonensis]RQP44277.1 DUF4123 domain-containing protein [Burkholderia ubonensis]RQP54787.1 DUF4123 domain-containing protein [Burkholderia ubonensis]
MSTTLELQQWSRRVVEALPRTNWTSLTQGPRPWLCLNGAHSETLEEDVLAVTNRFDYHWIWRDTAWEYGAPGYRQGPMLVPLDESLYAHAVECWLRQRAGLILLGPDEEDALVYHLQRLRLLTASDGFPIGFSLHAARQLEELCEGLRADRLSELFGPIQRFVWYAGDEQMGEWLSVNAPASDRPASVTNEPIALSSDDENALDQASLAWFMRDCAREFRQRFPAYDHPDNEPMLWRYLAHFANEATDQLALTTERDVRYYMALRFQYPHDYFAKDSILRDTLIRRQVDGKQRLFAAAARLKTLALSA